MTFLVVFSHASAMLIAAIFAVAGVSKLRPANMSFYQQAIDNYALTPPNYSALLVGALGVFEVVVAALIVLPISQFIGLVFSIALLGIYMAAFIKVIREGKANIECGCSGPGSNLTISYALILRNVSLITLALLGLSFSAPLSSTTWFVSLLTLAVLGLIYASAQQLIANGQIIRKLRDSRL